MLLISDTCERFPRAWLQPPRRCENLCSCGVFSSSYPAGVATFHYNQL